MSCPCRPPLGRRQTARGRRRLTKQVKLVRIGLVAQARSRLDSFRKITPPALAKVHSRLTRTCFAEPFTRVNRVVQAIQFDIESQITGTTYRSGISSELGQPRSPRPDPKGHPGASDDPHISDSAARAGHLIGAVSQIVANFLNDATCRKCPVFLCRQWIRNLARNERARLCAKSAIAGSAQPIKTLIGKLVRFAPKASTSSSAKRPAARVSSAGPSLSAP